MCVYISFGRFTCRNAAFIMLLRRNRRRMEYIYSGEYPLVQSVILYACLAHRVCVAYFNGSIWPERVKVNSTELLVFASNYNQLRQHCDIK